MIYRGPDFLAVVWFGSSPTRFSPSPVTSLSLFLSLPVCHRPSLMTWEGKRRWARSQIIRPRESLALYKSFILSACPRVKCRILGHEFLYLVVLADFLLKRNLATPWGFSYFRGSRGLVKSSWSNARIKKVRSTTWCWQVRLKLLSCYPVYCED